MASPYRLRSMQARYYDPAIGRFLSVDPVNISDNGNPIYFNRYAYVGNDPINAWDPDGEVIKIVGSEDYRRQTHMNLTKIKISNPRSAARIKAMQESSNVHTIRQPVAGEQNNQNVTNPDQSIGQTRQDESNGNGVNTDTLINDPTASKTLTKSDGTKVTFSPESILAHELLGHGGDKDEGNIDRSIDRTTGTRNSELSAMDAANEYRNAVNEEIREEY